MKPSVKPSVVVVVALIVLALFLPFVTLAHEHREVGPYVFTFGWRQEPAYAGVFNGPEVSIVDRETGEPVEGAEEGLFMHVTFGGQVKRLFLSPVFGQPGQYTADLIPTRPGDYSFHLTGTLGEMAIDQTFTSADGAFSSVEPASDIAFPELPADDVQTLLSELQAQIDNLHAELAALRAR